MPDSQLKAETQAEGEAGSVQEPNGGLDPRTPGSRPESKADAQLLSHPGAPPGLNFWVQIMLYSELYFVKDASLAYHTQTKCDLVSQSQWFSSGGEHQNLWRVRDLGGSIG